MEDNFDIVVLQTEKGDEVQFREVAAITLKGNHYLILQPVELLEGMEEDEALVFKVTFGKNGNDHFEIELDDDVIDAVFTEYYRLLDEQGQ